jgi:small-conductance mechanosensitive channel
LDLRIGFWINDPENGKLSVLSNVNLAIFSLLKELDVEIPYPQSVVTLHPDTR